MQLTQTGKKRKKEMETIDFISVRKQQNLKEEAEINPIEIKSEKIRFKRYLKNTKKRG